MAAAGGAAAVGREHAPAPAADGLERPPLRPGRVVGRAFFADSTITGNTTSGLGGGVFVAGSTDQAVNPLVEFSNTWITSNQAQLAGGGVATGTSGPVSLILEDSSVVSSNQALNPNAKGGGVFLGTGSLSTFLGTAIIFNSAGTGGGVYQVTGTAWNGTDDAFVWFNTPDNTASGG